MICLTMISHLGADKTQNGLSPGTWPAGLRRLQELGQTIEVDHEAEPNVAAYDALISLVDLLDGDGFDI